MLASQAEWGYALAQRSGSEHQIFAARSFFYTVSSQPSKVVGIRTRVRSEHPSRQLFPPPA